VFASVQQVRKDLPRTPSGLGGRTMSTKEKLLFLWILVVVAFSLVFHHFWATTIYALGRAVALTLIPLLGLAKIAAGIYGVHLLL
jgi:hypothetical protein